MSRARPLARSVEALNSECFCASLDRARLAHALEAELGSPGLFASIAERCPYVFSARPVFVAGRHLDRMAEVVRIVEEIVLLPSWKDAVFAMAPPIARHDPGCRGVFLGFDFHIGTTGPTLIEINTNAGGAMLNAVLARAQRACCPEMEELEPPAEHVARFEEEILAMFRQEWHLSGRAGEPRTVAIVDHHPEGQYLYPEFLLFAQLFERQGWRTFILDPAELELVAGRLRHRETVIDLVYNRLTDFYFEAAENAVLRAAWLSDAAVITPHPRAHALYADKRNLARLADAAWLRAIGVSEDVLSLLAQTVPATEIVRPEAAERLWAERRRLFFKPASGYGSRAAYRGDKLTRRVFEEILARDYVAQAFVPPSTRVIEEGGAPLALKFDLRNYVYRGRVQWVAARLYQGQTTNLRTPGGGFAPVWRLENPASSKA